MRKYTESIEMINQIQHRNSKKIKTWQVAAFIVSDEEWVLRVICIAEDFYESCIDDSQASKGTNGHVHNYVHISFKITCDARWNPSCNF